MNRDFPHRRQVLVGLGGEIVPDVSFNAIGGQGTASVSLKQRHRNPQLGGQVIVFREIFLQDNFLYLLFELVCFRPTPITVPATQVVGAYTAVGEKAIGFFWQLAGMATRATLPEHFLAM